jgi:hypothetical protein
VGSEGVFKAYILIRSFAGYHLMKLMIWMSSCSDIVSAGFLPQTLLSCNKMGEPHIEYWDL